MCDGGRKYAAVYATKVPKKLQNTRIFVELFPKSANSGFESGECQAVAERQDGHGVDRRM